MAKFVITKRVDGEFQFVLKNDDKTLLSSEGYTNMSGCENGIESVRKNSTEDGRYAISVSKNGKHYFNLKAGNGQIIGTSSMHDNEKEATTTANLVKELAGSASVDNQVEA